jgi:DNA transposition AAA+ family ATPase
MHTNSLPPTDRDEPVVAEPATKTQRCNLVLRDKLRTLRASSAVYSNAQLGAKLGYSSGVLSQYLSDDGCKYEGNIPGLEKKIEDFLQALERRRASGIDTHPSKTAAEMLDAFEYIRKTNDCGAIIAESGEGKTRGIELIQKKHDLAILVEATEWSCDKHSIMNSLWTGCAVDGWDRRSERFPYLVQKMRGSDRPIIVDDAHKLSQPALSLLTTWQEMTACPLALVGTPELVSKLESDPQRYSRIGINWAIKAGGKDNKLLLHMVRSIAKDANGDLDDLLELCGQVAAHHGHNRAVHKQLKLAAEMRHADDTMTWPAAFKAAHTHLARKYQLT